jgi:hypothetical protein
MAARAAGGTVLKPSGKAGKFAFTPCASDAEFLEKLRYLYAQQAKIWDLPDNGDDYGCIVIAAACHFCPVKHTHDATPALSHLEAPRAVLGLAAAARGSAAPGTLRLRSD